MAGNAPQHGGEYRQFLPDLSIPRFTTMKEQDARVYAKAFKEGGVPPWLHALYLHWLELLKEPFKGVTNDGHVRTGLFKLQDEGVPIGDIVDATNRVISGLDEHQSARIRYHIDSPEWRTWSNPEFLLSDKGIRLDELSMDLRDKVMKVLQTTLSPEGYEKAVGAMRINGFLGELVQSPAVMNEFSYNFVLFGEPALDRPWGFSFYGHHLCLNIFLYKTQIIASPWFTGAEPNLIDQGPYKGTRILEVEERLGLQLMQSLPPDVQSKAQVYKQMKDPQMPHGRWNHDDQRHLCGAYRDNRVVPYEGVLVSGMTAEQRSLVLDILNQYLLFLPQTAREIRLRDIESWFKETYFCWIGGFSDADPFYFRLQSPVILIEFDHHSGVFLTNKEPAKFHIHTLLRTPNAGDYGMALRPLIPAAVKQEFVWEG
ncbi:NAD(P)-binding protein [Pleurostoma richardsiae]|uniref:NAD(P)-binding protein n=1 Tax=Pleurostoma richardsiae TaxID=41990 RepID=A0AA38RRV8_9PEZI|nr:NAD(P)-binding protein [Pleurostoma richardsiae]